MTLDKKLARLRKREGLSQAEVSEELDVSRQAVTKWETGTSRPSTENLQCLSKLYNVPLETLLDDTKDIEKRDNISAEGRKENDQGQEGKGNRGKNVSKMIVGIFILIAGIIIGILVYKVRSIETTDIGDITGEQVELGRPGISIEW